MIENILAILWANIWWIVAAILLRVIWVMARPFEKRNIDIIREKIEIEQENKHIQRLKKTWPITVILKVFNLALDMAIWPFSFFFGWARSEDKTIQEKLEARSKAFKNTLADNYEIGLYTNKADKVENLSNEATHVAYRFSVVDLFVEKAIVILENQARPYKLFGVLATVSATVIILVGMLLASAQSGVAYEVLRVADFNVTSKAIDKIETIKHNMAIETNETLRICNDLAKEGAVSGKQKDKNISNKNEAIIKALVDRETNLAWKDMTVSFIKSFTFYGLLVLSAVFLQRYGKALLDQSERLLDRRHALRQGRLYLHLRNGSLKMWKRWKKRSTGIKRN